MTRQTILLMINTHTLYARGKSGIVVHVRPPRVSTFRLAIFGSVVQDEKQSHSMCTYYLKCNSVSDNIQPYAKHSGIMGPKANYADFGFSPSVGDKVIIECTNGEADIKIPTTREVSVLTRLELTDGSEVKGAVMAQSPSSDIILSVRMPAKGYYRLLVFAPDAHGKQKDVLYYMLHCKNPPNQFSQFPTTYTKQCAELKTRLLEPKTKLIPANKDVVFRFNSDFVSHVNILGKIYRNEKDGDEWKIVHHTPEAGKDVTVFGGKQSEGAKCLYTFQTE